MRTLIPCSTSHILPAAPPAPDLAEAARFIALLTGDVNAIVTFQTFDDSSAKSGSLARVFHGTLDEHGEKLMALNNAGAGVFVMVNEGDGVIHEKKRTCRTEASVVRVRALFVDLDGAPLEPLQNAAAQPDIIVESSPGRYHGYWLGVECPLASFKSVQIHLARKFKGDESVCDIPRVMRVPGFVHQKSTPFLAKVIKP